MAKEKKRDKIFSSGESLSTVKRKLGFLNLMAMYTKGSLQMDYFVERPSSPRVKVSIRGNSDRANNMAKANLFGWTGPAIEDTIIRVKGKAMGRTTMEKTAAYQKECGGTEY